MWIRNITYRWQTNMTSSGRYTYARDILSKKAGADPGEVKWVNFHPPFSESSFFFFLIPQILKYYLFELFFCKKKYLLVGASGMLWAVQWVDQ